MRVVLGACAPTCRGIIYNTVLEAGSGILDRDVRPVNILSLHVAFIVLGRLG